MLLLIATPIGNLSDISERALHALALAEIVLCEDTRVADKLYSCLFSDERKALLSGGRPRFMSYHKFNEHAKIDEILAYISQGKPVVLISDAGTPTISDPGQVLVQACHKHNLPVSIIPGPCAFVSAYAVSGFQAERLQFIGFLPKSIDERKIVLRESLTYPGATVAYESPERVFDTVSCIAELAPLRKIALVRELTKKYEETVVTTAQEMRALLNSRHEKGEIRGEIALVLATASSSETLSDSISDDLSSFVQEVIALKEAQKISLSEACALVAKAHGIKKNRLYSACLKALS